jgi:hypothetical protein
MEITIPEHTLKELVKNALVEIIIEQKDEFYHLIVDAIEEVGLIESIRQGRKNKFVDESNIMKLLEN